MKNPILLCLFLLFASINTSSAQAFVNFEADVREGCDVLTVQFTDLSFPAGMTILNWQWDFWDGTTSNLQNPTHVYSMPFSYNVTLIVTYDSGLRDTLTKNDYIKVYDSQANTILACNNFVNVSLGLSGEVTITPDMILEGGPYPCMSNYTIEIRDSATNVLYPQPVNCDHIGKTLEITVIAPNGNLCWGHMKVEDKLGVSNFNIVNASCSPGMDGAIEIDLLCPSIPVTYTWTGPNGFTSTLEDISGLSQGSYTLTLDRGSNGGIIVINNLVVGTASAMTIDFTQTLDDCNGPLYTILPTVYNGCAPFQYTWSDGSIGQNCLSCFTGNYSVTVVDCNGCIVVGTYDLMDMEECVWPGDTDLNDTVNQYDIINLGLGFGATGAARPNASSAWMGYETPNWSQSTPVTGVNYKHIDADGNGTIDFDDIDVIQQNWGEFHNFTDNDTELRGSGPPLYVGMDTLEEGAAIQLPLFLGDVEMPANNVYGLAFTIEYPDSLVVPGSVSLQFNNSWLGTLNTDMVSIQQDVGQGELHVGITRIDGMNRSGDGIIGQLFITIEDDVLFHGGSVVRNGLALPFNVKNVRMVSATEETLPVDGQVTSSRITEGGTTGIIELQGGEAIKVFPNPADQQLYIISAEDQIDQLSLFTMSGQLVQSIKVNNKQYEVSTAALNPGVYVLKMATGDKLYSQRVVILRN